MAEHENGETWMYLLNPSLFPVGFFSQNHACFCLYLHEPTVVAMLSAML
jgi:hypothetical protein